MKTYIRRALFSFMMTCISPALYADDLSDSTVHDIDMVTVVTAGSKPAVKQSAPVQIMSKDKIEILGLSNLSDAVQTFSGVNITDYGGVGGMKTVSVRSLGAHHTAVSYDGVIVSNAQGGQVDISNFTLNNIDEVTLTIGQGDDIFQAARNFESSGVLNIRSSAPKFIDQKIKADAGIEIGSFGYYNPTLDFATKISDRWSMTILGEWMKSDGDYPFTLTNNQLVTKEYRNNSDVETLRSEINLYGRVGKGNGSVYIKGNFINSQRGLPGGIIYYNNTSKERLWDRNRFIQAGYSTDFNNKWSLKTHTKYSYAWNKYADWGKQYNNGYIENRYTQEEYYLNGSLLFKPNRYWSFTLAQDIVENRLITTLKDCPDPVRVSSFSALAGQYKDERLTITGSLLGVMNHDWALRETYGVAPDRAKLSPAISASYKILRSKDMMLRASFKDAYRVPTFNDLYYSTMGNLDLVPESAKQYNLGVTYGGRFMPKLFDYATLSVDCYYNKIEDKIVAIPTMFLWKMLNLGEVQIKGIDLNATTYFTLFNSIKCNVSGNYTFQNAINVTNSTDKNYMDQIPYTAQHSGNIMATCSTKWFDLGYTAVIVGDRYSLPQNIDTNLIDGYVDQNVNISRAFDFKHTSLKLRAEVLNICNVNYDVIKYYPMPGRQYRLSVQFNY